MSIGSLPPNSRLIATQTLRRCLITLFLGCCSVILIGSGLNHLGHKYTRVANNNNILELSNAFTVGRKLSESEEKLNENTKGNTHRKLKDDSSSGSSKSSSNGKVIGGAISGGPPITALNGQNITAITSGNIVDSAAARNSEGVRTADQSCKRQILATNIPDSVMCCDSALRHSDWVCVAAFDRFNKVLSSTWAYLIPLLPWALSAAVDSGSTPAHARRLLVYMLVFVARTIILYKALGWVQTALQPDSGSSCWYAVYTKHNTCLSDNFDFSDHVVLYVANYMVPAVLEAAYAYTSLVTLSMNGTVQWLRYAPVIGASLIMTLLTFRGLLFTCMFFHSPLESAVGMGVVSLFILAPLYVLAGSSYWHHSTIAIVLHKT